MILPIPNLTCKLEYLLEKTGVFQNQTENIIVNVVLIVATITDDESLGKHHWRVIINLRITAHAETNSDHSSAANEDTAVASGLDVRRLDVVSKRSSNALRSDSSPK